MIRAFVIAMLIGAAPACAQSVNEPPRAFAADAVKRCAEVPNPAFKDDPTQSPHVTACPPPVAMTADELQTANYDQLVAFLTSRSIGRHLFEHNPHGELPLEYVRTMALTALAKGQ